jgi:hypothetical protein
MADEIREPTPSERAEMEYYLSQDLDSLLITIGRSQAGGAQFSPETAEAEGRRWFERAKADFRTKICDKWGYCRRRSDERLKDRVTLAVMLTDAIGSCVGAPPLFSIGALLVKMGLDDFCGCK